ncbi:MAG: Maf family protein [Chloroflexota bacterium]
MTPTFILASGSPRRRELIRLLGLPFEIRPVDVDENSAADSDPITHVRQIAELKARVVADVAQAAGLRLYRDGERQVAGGRAKIQNPKSKIQNAVIVAADTAVALDGKTFGKPADAEEARRMLRQLRGRVHQVHTGLAVIHTASGRLLTDVATVDVPMRNYSDVEIEDYVATGDPMDKAGAYAIQHASFRPVVGLAGCYAGVMGLPLCHLARALRRLGVTVPVDVAAGCMAHNQYDCPVYASILTAL